MATKKQPISLDEVIAEIEDTLPELCLIAPEFGKMTRRGGLIPGYYVRYWIYKGDVDRAVFLGDGVDVKKLKRKFDDWAMNWRV